MTGPIKSSRTSIRLPGHVNQPAAIKGSIPARLPATVNIDAALSRVYIAWKPAVKPSTSSTTLTSWVVQAFPVMNANLSSSSFGQVQSAFDPRTLQFALKDDLPCRGARTPACRVRTLANARLTLTYSSRSHDCERGTHECARHNAVRCSPTRQHGDAGFFNNPRPSVIMKPASVRSRDSTGAPLRCKMAQAGDAASDL
jgi:hypothetical protein